MSRVGHRAAPAFAACVLSLSFVCAQEVKEATGPTGALSLTDGRFVFGKPIEKKKDGVVVKFQNGDIFVPSRLVSEVFSTDANFKYEPKNAKEKAKLDKGLVPLRGRWMSKKQAEREIVKLQKKMQKRIETQREYKLWRNARRVETKNFKFVHNLPQELFVQLKDLMEEYYKTFRKYWGLKTKLSHKPTVNLYADRGDFNQISGASGGVVGWYHLISNQLHVYWDKTDPAFTIDVLFHEANHMLSDMVNGKFRYPHWIEEAMAEYYGASHWDKKKKKMSLGHIQAGRLQEVKSAISSGKWMKLDDLIGYRGYSSYNWGWSFVHFMMESKYQPKWKSYWKTLAHGRGVKRQAAGPFRSCERDEQLRLLLKTLKIKSLKQLEKEWHAHVKKLEVKDVSGLEQAGRKLRTMGKLKEARKYLEQAISKGAKNPYTYAAYADVLYRGTDRSKAIDAISKAIELMPLEPEFYYKKGKILERSSKKDEAMKLYKLASEMEPESWTYASAAADV